MPATVLFALIFLVSTYAAGRLFEFGRLVPAIYLASSLVTFLIFAWDKRAAINKRPRIAEKTFYLLSVLGGWPGALIGQHQFRHKTQKQPFKSFLWLSICVNIALLIWLMNSSAAAILHNLGVFLN